MRSPVIVETMIWTWLFPAKPVPPVYRLLFFSSSSKFPLPFLSFFVPQPFRLMVMNEPSQTEYDIPKKRRIAAMLLRITPDHGGVLQLSILQEQLQKCRKLQINPRAKLFRRTPQVRFPQTPSPSPSVFLFVFSLFRAREPHSQLTPARSTSIATPARVNLPSGAA